MADKKKKGKRLEELRGMSGDDLNAALDAARRAIYQIRRERLSTPQSNVKATRANRKEVARILTLQRERQTAQGAQS